MAVTIKDIAKVCNVSYSTVSRVLNEKCVRKSERNDKIIATAKALGYTPNKLAVQLVKKQTNMLGLMVPDIVNNPHYPEITKSVEDTAIAAGYQVFLCNTDWDVTKEVMYRDALVEKRVAGIVVMPVCDESHVIFRNLDMPVVLLGSRTREPDLHYVVMDNIKAGYDTAEYLIKLGHRKIAYIGRNTTNYTSSDRMEGFFRAIEHYGIAKSDVPVLVSDSNRLEGGYLAAQCLLNQKELPTAIVAFNDLLALGVMQAIEEHGLQVGKDISVIGFDDILFSALPQINLTTVTPSKTELGKRAVEIILRHYSNNPLREQQKIILPAQRIERKTCGKIENI